MALLAEQKRKAKFGLDPRNTSWSNDTSKFGQRLMEKMGWEKGKGLGSKEDGMTEHIKASYKSDTRGLGCTPQTADAWIAHQDEFNDLLKMLNSQNEASGQEETPEKTKPADGHKRYYGRFSRGQVQTLRSTEDLDCIFGRRKTSGVEASSEKSTVDSCCGGTEEAGHGLKTITSTSSVQEYFAKKMAELKARKEARNGHKTNDDGTADEKGADNNGPDGDKEETRIPHNGAESTFNSVEGESGTDVQVCRGWYQNFSETSHSSFQGEDAEVKLSKTKRKKNKKQNDDDDAHGDLKLSSKKCKVRDEQKTTAEFKPQSHKNSNCDELPEIRSSENMPKKRKNKEKKTPLNNSEHGTSVTDDGRESKRKKKSKKRKKDFDEEVVTADGSSTDNAFIECNGTVKKRKLVCNNIGTDISSSADATEKSIADSFESDYDVTKKKKKNRQDASAPVEDVSKHEKVKKKKRKQSQTGNEEVLSTSDTCTTNDGIETKSKKRNKRKDSDVAESQENETEGTNIADNTAFVGEDQQKGSSTKINAGSQLKMSKHEKKMKKKEKKKKRKMELSRKKSNESDELFPGSNVADIAGYEGLNRSLEGKTQ